MKVTFGCKHLLWTLPTLWTAFATVLLVVAIGLGLLSRHALQLQSEQRFAQHRERLLQNVRIALWRLDSRLAPYIATIHHLSLRDGRDREDDSFIRQRFRIVRSDPSGSGPMNYQPDESRIGIDGIEIDKVVRPENVDALLSAVEQMVSGDVAENAVAPEAAPPYAVQSKAQRYIAGESVDPPISSSGLKSRTLAVQNQVAINQSPTLNPRSFNQAIDSVAVPQMLSVWIDGNLAIVRSNQWSAAKLEGVWIDWDSLHRSLIDEIRELLPEAIIRPAGKDEAVDPEYALASLPAVLISGNLAEQANLWSPTHTALLLAWCAFCISAIVASFALHHLLALSERRAAFVSAVTHELRTPLTTFRLYSDLLAREVVTDPQHRQSYLETLRRESDRLTHLVDNVLRYSRLERTSASASETLVVSDWIDRVSPRLRSRLDEAEMILQLQQSGDGNWRTDPPAMEQVLFNLVDNAAKYAADAMDRRVHLKIDVSDREISFTIADHGAGVPKSLRKSIFQPFTKSAQRAAETAAGVGLGLALVKRTVTALGGQVRYQQAVDGGAEFRVSLPRS